jgi:hypothetical protein
VEKLYADRFGPAIVAALTNVTGQVAVSFAELAIAVGIVVWTGWLAVALFLARRHGASIGGAVADHGWRTASFGLAAACAFYLLWGANYARPTIVERLEWDQLEADATTHAEAVAELEVLAGELVAAANAEYVAAFGVPDMGRASAPPRALDELDPLIDGGFATLAAELPLGGGFGLSRGPAKSVASSAVLTRLGVSGFYFPWTGEANYNSQVPGYQLPLVIAHEKAHQRGIASEDEANFVGFLAGAHSDDGYVRYSSYMFAGRQLLSELLKLDEQAAYEIVGRRLPGVQRDVDAGREFWLRHEGRGTEVHRELNDAYLRAHGVEGGVESYSRSARLIVLLARAQGGSVAVGGGRDGELDRRSDEG